MKIRVILGLCVVSAMFAALRGDVPQSQPAKTFTVATYNINYGNPNLKTLVRILREGDADVVALQETNAESERYIRRHLKTLYPVMKFRRAPAAGGFGFLSKTPLKDVKYYPKTAGWFGSYQATVTLGGREVRLVNLHLQPTLPQRGDTALTFLKRWRELEKVRVKELAAIFKTLPKPKAAATSQPSAGKAVAAASQPAASTRPAEKTTQTQPAQTDPPCIFLGDFNSIRVGKAVPMLEAKGYVDAYLKAKGEAAGGATTWRWRYQDKLWKFRIDYIFAPPAMKVAAGKIDPRDASDHRYVRCTFSWKP